MIFAIVSYRAKKMKEFAIFFHQNQLLEIRKFQEELCSFLIKNGILCVPFSPLMIQIENLNEDSKISSINIPPFSMEDFKKSNYQKNGILSLKAQAEIDGIKKEGKIKILKIFKDFQIGKDRGGGIFSSGKFLPGFEKVSPFRICEIEIEEKENSSVWKILSEKWIKAK